MVKGIVLCWAIFMVGFALILNMVFGGHVLPDIIHFIHFIFTNPVAAGNMLHIWFPKIF